MAVHLPEVNRFSRFGSFLACLPEVRAPVDTHPSGFFIGWLDGGDELFLLRRPLCMQQGCKCGDDDEVFHFSE